MIEIPAIGPKLILDAFAPEVAVDEQEALDTVDLIEQQRNLGLVKRPLLLALARPVLLALRSGDPRLLVEPLQLRLDVLDGVGGEGGDLAGFRVLQGDEGL